MGTAKRMRISQRMDQHIQLSKLFLSMSFLLCLTQCSYQVDMFISQTQPSVKG